MLLQIVAYALLWQGPFWTYNLQLWQYILSATFFLLTAAIIIFNFGTEIRVHIEERLLKSQFADTFKHYQQ